MNTNTSYDQSVPFDDVRSATLNQECLTMLDNPEVYSVLCVGSVKFMSSNITADSLCKHLDECLSHAILSGKSKFVVLNGANFSGNEEGTTYTSSNWVQNTYNKYKDDPTYQRMEFYCLGFAPHSTSDMHAIWMEEQSNTRTKTFIITLQAKDRQELLAIYGTHANKVIVNEGASGTFHEVYTLFKADSSMFSSKSVIINNSSYLLNTIIPNILNNTTSYDIAWVQKLHTALINLYC